MCGLALALPLLSVFGQAPDQFALRGAAGIHIVGFAVGVTVLPPVLMWGFELVVGLVRDELRIASHRVLVALLAALVAVQVVPHSVERPVAYAIAVGVGVAAAAARERWEAVRLWLAFAALAPVGFAVLFLATTPTGRLIGASGAHPSVEVGAPAPIVMVVLDELPLAALLDAEGNIDAELFPSFAELASRSHWFRNTTSVAPGTWHAVPAIATGRMPADGEGPTLADHPENLFTLLDAQYELNVEETVTRLCPASSCPGRATGAVVGGLVEDLQVVLRERLRVAGGTRDPVGAGDADRLAGFRSLMRDLSGEPATLSYVHLLMPHLPARYLPDGSTYADFESGRIGRDRTGRVWLEDEWLPLLTRQRHLLQTMYVDRLLGEVLGRLRAEGTFDDALIVVTADHGVSFEPGGPVRGHLGEALTDASTPDLLWVPFLVKEPGQSKGSVSDDNVLTIDVLPTIADVLDVELPWEVDGRSALGPPRATADKPWRGGIARPWGVGVTEELTIEGAEVWPTVLERSVGRLLPPPGDPYRLWRIGPAPELVGTRAADLGERIEPIDLHRGDPGAGPLVHAWGTDLEVGDVVVAVVDGQVAATGPAFLLDGRVEVAMMVDPSTVSGGASVELFRLR
jgi:hypothetical protein